MKSKIFAYLLTDKEKEEIKEKEQKFLKLSFQARQKLLERIMLILPNAKNPLELAKTIEILSKEINNSFKTLKSLSSVTDSDVSDLDDDMEEIYNSPKFRAFA